MSEAVKVPGGYVVSIRARRSLRSPRLCVEALREGKRRERPAGYEPPPYNS